MRGLGTIASGTIATATSHDSGQAALRESHYDSRMPRTNAPPNAANALP